MIEIKRIRTFGWEGAIRGMRNPMNSWEKSDSNFEGQILIGEEDLKLACNLIKAGSSDRKFLRMIHVQLDITAPLYWWKECDTYKIATVSNSCSTMHKIHSRDLTLDDFSTDKLTEENKKLIENIISVINFNRISFTKDKDMWYQMIQLLPSSYNQTRTLDLNYETLLNIYFQRRHHKLDEWKVLCNEIEKLPYMKNFIKSAEK